MSLYEVYKRENPRRFQVDRHNVSKKAVIDEKDYISKDYSCFNCVVKNNRSPEHCDPCSENPDRERMKRAGLL